MFLVRYQHAAGRGDDEAHAVVTVLQDLRGAREFSRRPVRGTQQDATQQADLQFAVDAVAGAGLDVDPEIAPAQFLAPSLVIRPMRRTRVTVDEDIRRAGLIHYDSLSLAMAHHSRSLVK
jgi:hypothetical protein